MNAAVADLFHVIDRALERGASLLTAGERAVVRRMRELQGPAAIAYARLTTRVGSVHGVDGLTIADVPDVRQALAELASAGLVDGLVRWDDRARALTKPDLQSALRRLGLPHRGRRDVLVLRLQGHRGWSSRRFVRVRHRALVRRLERWAFLRPFPDRATLVKDRLGIVRWPAYRPTRGAVLPERRQAWLAYEALADGLEGRGAPLTPERALVALSDGTARLPGRLDLTRVLGRALLDEGYALERQQRPAEACALYERMVRGGGMALPTVAFRWAQAEVARGRPRDALDLLREARPLAAPANRLGLVRTMSRIARKTGQSVAPEDPLRPPTRRGIRLTRHPTSMGRPRWGADGLVVEAAVCRWLREHGRLARFGEGRPYGTLFALLFADVLFMEVPGALPVRFLTAPIDLGTRHFRAAREDAIAEVFAAVDRGDAPRRLHDAWDRWAGVRIAGARWEGSTPRELQTLAEHLGPRGLRTILEPMIDHGPREGAGLPDLVVWPGSAVRLPDALPSRLGPGLCLVEIKGPTDRLQDRQRMWMDRLVRADVRTELWEVSEPPG